MIKRVLVFAFVSSVLCCGVARAASVFATGAAPSYTTVGTATTFGGSGGAFAELIRDRTYIPAAARGTTLDDLLKMPYKTGAHIGFGRTASALAVGSTLATAIGIGVTAMAIAEIANEARCRLLDGITGCDDGAVPETVPGFIVNQSPATNGTGPSVSAACASAAAAWQQHLKNTQYVNSVSGTTSNVYTVSVANETPTGNNCNHRINVHYVQTQGGACQTNCVYQSDPQLNVLRQATAQSTNVNHCPESIDASNPANNIPAGAPVGSDGKCKTGRYAPKTVEQVRDKIKDLPDTPEQNLRRARALEEALKRGLSVETDPGTARGPATIVGQPTTRTSTTPEGTTTTTRTPTTRFGYNGPTVTAEDDVTERTVNPDGSIEQTTDSGLPPAEVPLTDCEKFPDDIGCMDSGTPPDTKPEWQEKTVVFTPESLGLSGSCPPPYTFTVHQIAMSMDYQPACDIAPIIRAGVLALTALGCMLWMFAAVKV